MSNIGVQIISLYEIQKLNSFALKLHNSIKRNLKLIFSNGTEGF